MSLNKQDILGFIENMGVNEPGKLYLQVKKHIEEFGYTEDTPTITSFPTATCESCEG